MINYIQDQAFIITGITGSGKTFLAQAIGYQACVNLYKVKYLQLPLFLVEIISLHSNNSVMNI